MNMRSFLSTLLGLACLLSLSLAKRDNYTFAITWYFGQGIIDAAANNSRLFPSDFKLNVKDLSSAALPGLALNNFDRGLLEFNAVTVSDREKMSTFVRTNQPDSLQAVPLAVDIRKLGWKRVGIVHDSISVNLVEALSGDIGMQYGIQVVNSWDVPLSLSRDNPDTMERIRLVVREMLNAKVFIFILSFNGGAGDVHSHIILEEAHKLGFFGSSKFTFFLANSVTDDYFSSWEFAQSNPEATVGLLTTEATCVPGPEYEHLKYHHGGAELTSNQCLFYDNHLFTLSALSKTVKFMDSISMDRQCLEYNYYFDNADICTLNNAEIMNKVTLEANCTDFKDSDYYVHHGVCETINFFKKYRSLDLLNYYQLLLLNSFYTNSVNGARQSNLQIDKFGDRANIGAFDGVINSQLTRNETSGKIIPHFVKVGTIFYKGSSSGGLSVEESTFDVTADIHYGGSTFDSPNLERTADEISNVYGSLSVSFRISWLVITGISIVLTIILFAVFASYRDMLIVKTSTPIMMGFMALGAVVSICSLIPYNVLPVPTGLSCTLFYWLQHCGWALAFGAVLLKTHRLNLIFNQQLKGKKEAKVNLLDKQLVMYLMVIVFMVLCYLAIWTGVSTPTIEESVILSKEFGTGDLVITKCKANWFQYSLVIVEFLFVAYGALLAFNVRKLPSFYNEAKVIAFIVYNWIFMMVVSQALVILVDFDMVGEHSLVSITIIWTNLVMMFSFFGFKIVKIFQ
eukprot:Awhi_evm1s14021